VGDNEGASARPKGPTPIPAAGTNYSGEEPIQNGGVSDQKGEDGREKRGIRCRGVARKRKYKSKKGSTGSCAARGVVGERYSKLRKYLLIGLGKKKLKRGYKGRED